MTANPRIRLVSELGQGDTVRTPRGRLALVRGFPEGGVELRYLDDGDECLIRPELLELVSRAPKHEIPRRFFEGVELAKGSGQ